LVHSVERQDLMLSCKKSAVTEERKALSSRQGQPCWAHSTDRIASIHTLQLKCDPSRDLMIASSPEKGFFDKTLVSPICFV